VREILEQLYAELSIAVNPDLLDVRTKGANAALRGLTPDRALGLVLLAHGSGSHPVIRDWLLERMESAGETLNRAYAQEIGVLAGSILLKAWTQDPNEAASVGALAVGSAQFMALKPRVPKLSREAKRYREQAALNVRRPGSTTLNGKGLMGEPEEAFPVDGTYPPEKAADLHRELKALRGGLATALDSLKTAIDANAEQTQILWWLFGERLLDGRVWSEVKEAASPLEFARDLAVMTRFVPGPSGANAFLVKAMRGAELDPERDLTVGGAFRVLSPDSRVRTRLPRRSGDAARLLPILCCGTQTEYPGGGQPGRLHRTALQMAEQFYRELLISEHLDESDE
jgi:GTPase-associated system helical domain